MTWSVVFSRQAAKQVSKLPSRIKDVLRLLVSEIEELGPVRGDWPNYGKLNKIRHHCHIKKGQPTYVAVWEEDQTAVRLVEVKYVGTHEDASY